MAQAISQKKLVVNAGVNRGYLGGLERLTENPTLDVIGRIAAALSVPMAKLLPEPEAREPVPAPLRGGRR